MSTLSARDLGPPARGTPAAVGPGSYDVGPRSRLRCPFVGFGSSEKRTMGFARRDAGGAPPSEGAVPSAGMEAAAPAAADAPPKRAPGPGHGPHPAPKGIEAPRGQSSAFRGRASRFAPVFPGSTIYRPSSVAANPGPGEYEVGARASAPRPARAAAGGARVDPTRSAPSIPRRFQSWGYEEHPSRSGAMKPLKGPRHILSGDGGDTAGPGHYDVGGAAGGRCRTSPSLFARGSERRTIFAQAGASAVPGPGAYASAAAEAGAARRAASATTSTKGSAAFASEAVRMDLRRPPAAEAPAKPNPSRNLRGSPSRNPSCNPLSCDPRPDPGDLDGAQLEGGGGGLAGGEERAAARSGGGRGGRAVERFGRTSRRGGWELPAQNPFGVGGAERVPGPGSYGAAASDFELPPRARLGDHAVAFNSSGERPDISGRTPSRAKEVAQEPGPGSYDLRGTGASATAGAPRRGVFGGRAPRFRRASWTVEEKLSRVLARQQRRQEVVLAPEPSGEQAEAASRVRMQGRVAAIGALKSAGEAARRRSGLFVGAARSRPSSAPRDRRAGAGFARPLAPHEVPTASKFATPAPGAYEIPSDFGRRDARAPSSFRASEQRFSERRLFTGDAIGRTPGPGAYRGLAPGGGAKGLPMPRAVRFEEARGASGARVGPGSYASGLGLLKKSFNRRFQPREERAWERAARLRQPADSVGAAPLAMEVAGEHQEIPSP